MRVQQIELSMRVEHLSSKVETLGDKSPTQQWPYLLLENNGNYGINHRLQVTIVLGWLNGVTFDDGENGKKPKSNLASDKIAIAFIDCNWNWARDFLPSMSQFKINRFIFGAFYVIAFSSPMLLFSAKQSYLWLAFNRLSVWPSSQYPWFVFGFLSKKLYNCPGPSIVNKSCQFIHLERYF